MSKAKKPNARDLTNLKGKKVSKLEAAAVRGGRKLDQGRQTSFKATFEDILVSS